MTRKILIASLTIIAIFTGFWLVNYINTASCADVSNPQIKSASEGIKTSDFIEFYEIKNHIVTSKESLEKGFELLFNKKPALEGVNCVPSLKIKFKKEEEFAAYIMDKHNVIFGRLATYPEITMDKGKDVVFFWPTAKYHNNDDYFFYIELYENNSFVCALKFPPIRIQTEDNNYSNGFYIISPPESVFPEGLITGNMIYSQTPTIAWVDTKNTGVVKYQLFDADIVLHNAIKPYLDNISPSKRVATLNKPLVFSEVFAREQGDMATGNYAFLIRAILKDGSYVDSEVSGGILIERPEKFVFKMNLYEKK